MSATYLLSSLLLDSIPVPLSRLDSIPARQTMEEKFPSCSKLPIALYLGCSTLNAGRLSSAPLQVSVVFSPPQSATSRWHPLEWVQRMQRVYDETARVFARKAEPEPERGECMDYEPEADLWARAVPWETRFARVSFAGFLGRRRCGQGSARSGVAGSAGGVLLGGGRRTYKSSFWEILVRGERASTEFGGGKRPARWCPARRARSPVSLNG
ncbi:hypothetical protein B0H14DRAFT_3138798 [Mycena olivaceomarginata]|nr:hypothetical protein B0H14DRAFT_3138798 [Mycena olivaceomarginata]